ncbi:MAG: hypothetical protein IH613_04970 [Desulfuromonadales bacterium]|nr:hypothetical protein [Desulfuromonadales bacterium]
MKANLVNNISYNVGSTSHTAIGSSQGQNSVAFAGNLYIAGPNTPSGNAVGATSDIVEGSEIYMSDNFSTDAMTNSQISSSLVNISPVTLANVTLLPSERVEDYVLVNAGARPGERDGIVNNGVGDSVDERLISEYWLDTASLKSTPPNMPAIPSTNRPFQMPVDPNGDDNNNGYTNIEEVLYQLSLDVEGK